MAGVADVIKPAKPIQSTKPTTSTRLAGIKIVVTRPEPAASKTVRALKAEGAEAIAMPLLEIAALPVKEVVATYKPLLEGLTEPTKVIFISTHAAQYGVPVLKKLRKFYPLARFIAIGAATAAKLDSLGVQSVFVPALGEDSEALLAAPMLQKIRGQTIVIVRGNSEAGGRTYLAESLIARGALVVAMVCYRRAPVKLSVKARQALKWAVANSTHVLAGSVETLDSLASNGGKVLMSRVPNLLVPHRRIARVAKQMGARQTTVVSLDDNNLVESLSNMVS